MNLPVVMSVHNILIFFLNIYTVYSNLDPSNVYHHMVQRYLRSISINSKFSPTPRSIFDIKTLHYISLSCDIPSNPILFKAIFVTAYFDFYAGQILLLMSSQNFTQIIQLPVSGNIFSCSVRALNVLLSSRPLSQSDPLFANRYPLTITILIHMLNMFMCLKQVLTLSEYVPIGHGFHMFRRSGVTHAFDHNLAIQNIMTHGLWRSSSIWTYLQNAPQAASIIPHTFSTIPPTF